MSTIINVQTTAQAETLCIYGIFLFLTGLSQIGISVTHRYLIGTTSKISSPYYWYVYPEWSASLTIIPFLCSVTYAIFKRRVMTVLICLGSFISFISSSVYIGLLVLHTIECWQLSSIIPTPTPTLSPKITTTTTTRPLFLTSKEPTFENLALLVILTMALVQSLLSIIGSVISFIWSPCCTQTSKSHHSHKHEVLSTTLQRNNNNQKQQQQHNHYAHRFITTDTSMINGFLQKSPLRTNYDDV
ncbi:unnamed protein product [Didymodactylos carnosus]|uniref:Uncharacterized protein n=1 Tax=Didymodactylos carnosus TaxID=1234261 RepID=A0A813NMY1_9BILA|nr:unnamed protein product [Didymodactylos carnosus]CAF3516088.1 unnamed protein product [Didymodactylos carnosus]